MPDNSDIADVFAHYIKLPNRDRKAVMAALDAQDRLRLKRYIALVEQEADVDTSEDSANDDDLTPLSPWLWDALESCMRNGSRPHMSKAAKSLLKRHSKVA